jgi:hypothetical protein
MQIPRLKRDLHQIALLCLIAVLVGLGPYGLSAEAGFSGTIHFTNGKSVFFDHLGTTSEVITYNVSGLFGQQKVSYSFAELGLILFSDKEPSTVIVVNKQGERFTLTDCEMKDGFLYVYNDTVTRKLDWTRAERKDISHIVIGQRSGKIKMNATTQEYFPAMFVFDPFTGERLVWAEQGQPVPGEPLAEPATYAPAASPTPAASPGAAPAPAPGPGAVDQATAPAAAGATSNLRLTVVTPSTAIFFLGQVELRVSIQGPALFKETVKDANVETKYTLNFKGIPSGDYRVVAKYGTSTAVSIVRVVGANVEYELAFD